MVKKDEKYIEKPLTDKKYPSQKLMPTKGNQSHWKFKLHLGKKKIHLNKTGRSYFAKNLIMLKI